MKVAILNVNAYLYNSHTVECGYIKIRYDWLLSWFIDEESISGIQDIINRSELSG